MVVKLYQWRAADGTQEGEDIECKEKHIIPVSFECCLKRCLAKPEKVKLHIFTRVDKIWEEKFKGGCPTFKRIKFETEDSVASVMDKILTDRAGSKHPWVVTEVWEAGDGEWKKGTTIPYASEKAAGTLKSFGWGSSRGKAEPPVWLVVHKK
ncbi:hypothetical protein AMS68_001983 [Peltaster fructicola]|uniref:Uncharacterized protein n=1 Tax=Peltaster fructicola TaxID=286661 RepID=A0A6H0XP57_9PEZI|nr:hypothetical protein AMS68_001983 [Peltaster fructicola]